MITKKYIQNKSQDFDKNNISGIVNHCKDRLGYALTEWVNGRGVFIFNIALSGFYPSGFSYAEYRRKGIEKWANSNTKISYTHMNKDLSGWVCRWEPNKGDNPSVTYYVDVIDSFN